MHGNHVNLKAVPKVTRP